MVLGIYQKHMPYLRNLEQNYISFLQFRLNHKLESLRNLNLSWMNFCLKQNKLFFNELFVVFFNIYL